MTEESILILRGDKCAGVIKSISELFGVSLQEAADIYYESETSNLIDDGVADLHCRSEKYLAQCIWDEYNESKTLGIVS